MQRGSLTAPVDINSDRNVCAERNLARTRHCTVGCGGPVADLSVQFPINARPGPGTRVRAREYITTRNLISSKLRTGRTLDSIS